MAEEKKSKLERFNELKKLAEDNGFELLETKWLGFKYKHRFIHLKNQREYEWIAESLFRQGFPKDLRTDIDHFNNLREFSRENGFELRESKWLGGMNLHRFIHKISQKEYKWSAAQVLGNGFPKNLRSNTERLNDLNDISEKNGFKLLETKWLGSKNKHRFLHKESQRIYEFSAANILNQGFPMVDGQRYLTQEVCRQAFSHIFGGEFRTNRDRLKEIHGSPIELDGYENFIGVPDALADVSFYSDPDGGRAAFNHPIAFEFQGYPNHREDEKTIKRDLLKADYCKREGILLVQVEPTENISFFFSKVRDSEFMYKHVCDSIQKAVGSHEKINFPSDFQIDLTNWNPDTESLLRLSNLAVGNGFELLEDKWLGSEKKHRFIHQISKKEYMGIPDKLFSRGFPADIRSNFDLFDELKVIAMASGFELCETQWLGTMNNHRFIHIKSQKEYQWKPNNLFTRGFPKNSRSNLDRFYELKSFAEEHGFELLETEWLGVKVKNRFFHKEGKKEYEWVPDQVLTVGFPKKFTKKIASTPSLQVSPAASKLIASLWTLGKTAVPFQGNEIPCELSIEAGLNQRGDVEAVNDDSVSRPRMRG